MAPKKGKSPLPDNGQMISRHPCPGNCRYLGKKQDKKLRIQKYILKNSSWSKKQHKMRTLPSNSPKVRTIPKGTREK